MTSTNTSASQTTRNNPLTSFGAQVICGLIAGVVFGFIARNFGENFWLSILLSKVGGTYVGLLKLMVPPLVVTAVVTSVANLRHVTNAARLAVKTVLWFMITAFFSVIVGIITGLIIRPGLSTGVDASAAKAPTAVGSWWGFVESIVPSNIFGLEMWVHGRAGSLQVSPSFNVLQLLVIAICFGIAAVQVGEKALAAIEVAEALLQIVQKVLWWIIRLAPIGTAALIGTAVASYGWGAMGSLVTFIVAIYCGLAIVIGVIYPSVLAFNGLSIRMFYRKVWPVTSLGFVTRSSMGTMPVTERTTEHALGVPGGYAAFAVPLGATTKMDGCAAIYPAIAAIFVSQFYGVALRPVDYVLIVIVSVLGSAATAGTTGATVMLTLTLSTLGLPLEGVGLLLAVEPVVDMGRTAINVTGQALVPLVVAKRENILDLVRFNDPSVTAESDKKTDTVNN